ncbi:MAG: MoaD/ThiS family protein [Gammaproteobacteria bacterium]|nr:MoaD/ThiS family protein [Gammaproteobacteria bacterium]
MARVFLPQQLHRLTGGAAQLDVVVDDYRGLMADLDRRFPGFRHAIEQDFALVIDGDIINDPLLEAIPADSEIHFLHRLGGG